MSNPPSLQAPWRIDYIRSIDKAEGCFICQAAGSKTDEERRERLVLWESEHCIVVINRYPYVNGHLLISPKAHKAELTDLTDVELLDLQVQTREAMELLKKAIGPQGFNVGINFGRCAGAGVPGHLHQHVVPRWSGDTNYMSVVGEVRVIPQANSQVYEDLMRVRLAGR
ncbi:MAG TPA: HIT domain-containing protein [Tepidisphaeraceae bacterium]|jgi:ATP adenylyltransferase|nr:HIT domain-containing protein [Tepidisphaeraceae bacterium]